MNNFSQKQYKERAVLFAEYILENKATVRTAAKAFGISKSTVHTEVTNQKKLWWS